METICEIASSHPTPRRQRLPIQLSRPVYTALKLVTFGQMQIIQGKATGGLLGICARKDLCYGCHCSGHVLRNCHSKCTCEVYTGPHPTLQQSDTPIIWTMIQDADSSSTEFVNAVSSFCGFTTFYIVTRHLACYINTIAYYTFNNCRKLWFKENKHEICAFSAWCYKAPT